MTANIREWRHFFSLRCAAAAHPQMRDLARQMLIGFMGSVPVLFDDLIHFLRD
jgi:thymidylate synthase (FAD)